MDFEELISDPRTSFKDDHRTAINLGHFDTQIAHLASHIFWDGQGDIKPLWAHQKTAICTMLAYINGEKTIPERPDQTEAALLKLPTGTGKSGIVAVLSRCLPQIRKVLVLTPRKALTEQLQKDICYRFWKHMGFEVEDGTTFNADERLMGVSLEETYVETFLPSNIQSMLTHIPEADRVILVGTHQSLSDIRKRAYGSDETEPNAAANSLLEMLADTFDLVVVDEGHYEPAVSWSRGVRELNKPTILLSATPYRNDYKSFRVRGRYLFNYPYAQAVEQKIIRPAEVIRADGDYPDDLNGAVRKFVEVLHRELPDRLDQARNWFAADDVTPKVMIRAADLEKLQLLQNEIDRIFEAESVLIHDRAIKTEQRPNRFQSVSSAMNAKPDAQFWIHQNKLMEGIDDPTYVAVAIFDLMGNARQLVQQIGRVTRRSNGDQRRRQTGWVIASPSNAERIQTTWKRYQGYEAYAAKDSTAIVANEVTLPDRLLRFMAEYQYIGGEFRGRFELEAPLAGKDIQLPQSAAVLCKEPGSEGIEGVLDVIEEAIMGRDRFKITPLVEMPENAWGFSYYAWRNSPYLVDRFFSEWKFGVFVAVEQDAHIFMHDTEGIVVDFKKLGLARADRQVMEKAFPSSTEDAPTRLSRFSFSSLEMSQNAIRGLAVRTRSFEDTFTDLLDPMLVPGTAFGFVNGTGRYVGFARARVRESSESYVPIEEYVSWTRTVDTELSDAERERSAVFDRYASIEPDLTSDEATPLCILLDPSLDAFMDRRAEEAAAARAMEEDDVDYEDLCSDINPEDGTFQIRIGGDPIDCQISFKEETQKYSLSSERLDELYPKEEAPDRRQPQTLVQRLNKDQAFRILVRKDHVVYAEGRFFRPKINWVIDGGEKPILGSVIACPSLGAVESEKGESFFLDDPVGWHRRSLFGVLAAACEKSLEAHQIPGDNFTRDVDRFSIVVCDDDGTEKADFIALDEDQKRLVFIHAKTYTRDEGWGGYNVSGLQEVGRQALASLTFISNRVASNSWNPERWNSDIQANTRLLEGRSRVYRNAEDLSLQDLNDRLCAAAKNPAFSREIWMLGNGLARRTSLSAGLDGDQAQWNPRLRQFLMHWDAMKTACARASVELKLYCS
ncbi:DEAD/DEAH box helicase [Roseovarius pacificus]|uniref:DEAD/DEAH box helicase n=1 Tax=Roseovarius pacificus TaxID=337701 RepID=UPI00403A4389